MKENEKYMLHCKHDMHFAIADSADNCCRLLGLLLSLCQCYDSIGSGLRLVFFRPSLPPRLPFAPTIRLIICIRIRTFVATIAAFITITAIPSTTTLTPTFFFIPRLAAGVVSVPSATPWSSRALFRLRSRRLTRGWGNNYQRNKVGGGNQVALFVNVRLPVIPGCILHRACRPAVYHRHNLINTEKGWTKSETDSIACFLSFFVFIYLLIYARNSSHELTEDLPTASRSSSSVCKYPTASTTRSSRKDAVSSFLCSRVICFLIKMWIHLV